MYIHSVRVPRLYKTSAKLLQDVKENGTSLKQQLYKIKHTNLKGIYALVAHTLEYFSEIESIIKKSKLFEKENRLDPWLARILIYELLWNGKKLNSECKPIKTIQSYQSDLEKHKVSLNSKEKEDAVQKVVKPRYVRINTLTCTIEEAINGFREEGWQLVPCHTKNYQEFLSQVSCLENDQFMVDLHVKDLFLFPSNTTFYKHRAYKMGSIILQDKASCLPVRLLNPPPGSTVLDMCAAPGMKTSYLAALLNGQGTIYAVEKSKDRFETMNRMIENLGISCIKTINQDVLKVRAEDCPNVEYILVDPSCSGSGMTERLMVNGKEEVDPKRLEKLSGFQVIILKHALLHFPQAKRVVYSTCSVYKQENEYVVSEVLKNTSNFKLVSAKSLLNGLWRDEKCDDQISEQCISTTPQKDLTNGFFIAVFERDESQNKLSKKHETSIDENFAHTDEGEKSSKKQKKNKRKRAAEIFEKDVEEEITVNTEENDLVDGEITDNSAKMKKKDNLHILNEGEEKYKKSEVAAAPIKKKKTKHQDNIIENFETYDGSPEKGKSKNKFTSVNNPDCDQTSTKKKKLKKVEVDADIEKNELEQEHQEILMANLKIKKKKIKKNSSSFSEDCEKQQVESEELSPKKKKSKKVKNEESEHEVFQDIEENSTKTSKRKKCKNDSSVTEDYTLNNKHKNKTKNSETQEKCNREQSKEQIELSDTSLNFKDSGTIGLEEFTNMLNASSSSTNNTTAVEASINDVPVLKKKSKKHKKSEPSFKDEQTVDNLEENQIKKKKKRKH